MSFNLSPQDDTVAKRERADLDAVLRRGSATADKVERVAVSEARLGAKVVTTMTGRTATRLLLITTNTSFLNQANASLDGYIALQDVFDEVHVVVLRTGIVARSPVLRVADTIWMYVAAAPSRLSTPLAAWRLIKEQFVFADGFRPDLIVARDPFESALVAYVAGRVYQRPCQLHLGQYLIQIKIPGRFNRLERLLAGYLIPKFASVRTITDEDKHQLSRWYPQIKDIDALPRYRGVSTLIGRSRTRTLAEKFPQFSFFILYIGDLGHDSTAFRALDAARAALQNPRVGMVIVGDGPARAEFMNRAKLLGVANHVIFERTVDSPYDYLLSADVLLVTDVTSAGDDWCIAAAASKTSVVATTTVGRSDIFGSGETILMADPTDTLALERSVMKILNDNSLCFRLTEAAIMTVLTRIHDDPAVYTKAYQESIERAIIVDDDAKATAVA